MLKSQDILPIMLISLISIGLISYLTVSHIHSLNQLNESANDLQDIKPLIFLDLNNKETEADIQRKIQHYKSIEMPILQMDISEIEEKEKKTKKLRNLEESNIFENVGLIDPLNDSYIQISKWIANSAKLLSSNVILYPYYFNYTYKEGNDTKSKEFLQGAFISLNTLELEKFNDIGLKSNGTFSAKKAKAVYNCDFAILSIEYKIGDNNDDVFQDSPSWSSYLSYYFERNTLNNFQEFLKRKTSNPNQFLLTKINEDEIIKGNLLNNGIPRFGILIIPDYILGTDDIIISKLGNSGINNIIDFYNKGGRIIVNGKSGTLLEDFGLMIKGVYNRKKLLSINNANRYISVKGWDKTYRKKYNENENDFEKQMVCLSVNNYRVIALASSFQSVKNDSSYISLLSLDSNNKNLITTDVDDGTTSNLTQEEKVYNPALLLKKNNKNGQIFVMNYNPVHAAIERNILLNIFSLALSRDLYMNTKVKMNVNVDSDLIDDLPIPAGEFGYQLQINLLIHNLNDKEMSNSKVYLFLQDNFGWASTPNDCAQKKYIENDIPYDVKKRKTIVNNKNYLLCEFKTIAPYKKYDLQINITVLNNEATQSQYQVLILEPILTFLDSNKEENFLFDQIRVNCEASPHITATFNPDPSAYYPVEGRGVYFDNVLKIENKEESKAYDVEYYGLIPLVSPLLDGIEQSKINWCLKIYADYYNSNKYEVPFTSDDAQDYIYPSELIGKGVIIISEWESPVLPIKGIYNKEGTRLAEEADIPGLNNGLVTINSTTETIRQVNYRKSENLFKLASHRLMVFIDTSTPEGAKTYYNGKIPYDLVDPIYGDRTKKEVLFTRIDIYFYDNKDYFYPFGISENHVFSIDKHKSYSPTSDCIKTRGNAYSKVEKGFFNNLDDDKKNIILQPSIYSNELFEYCNLTVIDPTEKGSIEKYFGNTENIKLSHFIIPNVENNLTHPGQLYDFVEIDKHHGYHKTYSSIGFIYLHSLKYILKAKYCKYGGKIQINIEEYELGSVDDVTVSPDQIAVYNIEYIDHIIIIYFKRGLMSNEQFGKDITLEINIENLKSEKNENFTVIVEDMIFDISSLSNCEEYYQIISEKKEFEYISAFTFPALQLKASLNRTLNGYEALEPFNRYGLYTQELNHRTVYGYAQTHHEKDPGVQGSGSCYSIISNLGMSSIPFIEYMGNEKGRLTPAASRTARISWKDIWGRTWQQPLRSTFPEYPVVPPLFKSFMMSTTYEIIRNDKQIYEWPSDENVKIHLHIKLLNNYPKYFEITRCKDNQIRFVPTKIEELHTTEFKNISKDNLTESELNGKNMYLRQGGMASYGICYANENAYVSGSKVEGELLKKIERAKLCANLINASLIKQCEKELEDIKTISKSSTDWDEEKDGKWNYSPLVENYYPKGYIEPDMWQMTHTDYYDTPILKAHGFHMDNELPNMDNYHLIPNNTIVIPIYKGLRYNIVYNKETEMNYHGVKKKGWWNDNLQNKDDTLLAGNDVSNKISVNKKSALVWVDDNDLVGSKREGSNEAVKRIVNYKRRNIYTCLFNRKRPQYSPEIGKFFYAGNVVENNVVPVMVDFDKEGQSKDNFKCNVDQYTEDNLYTFEGNYLETPTLKDYLYFTANLRGGAKESFNIVMNLNKFDKLRYEGFVKVNEGGRFVYWNPSNSKNSFVIVDDPVNLLYAKRNDIQLKSSIFPQTISTYNSVIYHSYIFKDEDKINKEWPYTDYYSNSYGFGDVTVSVSVGGIRNSKPTLEPGKTTYARIIFYNNCGYDWNMKGDAIIFEYKGDKRINANDLLWKYVHAIRKPLEYRFLSYSVEKEYSEYITIEPSDHNIEIPPEFFDFEYINLVTIRDGFKGEYNLKINVAESFPPHLRGRPIEIKIGINKIYFDKFPGKDSTIDPIQYYHPYIVTIPPIYIAVPFDNDKYKGKVFYTSARSSNLNIQFEVGVDWKIDGIKYVSEDLLEKMANATLEENTNERLNTLWNTLKDEKNISYSETKKNEDKKLVIIDGIKDEYEFFPKKNLGALDTAEARILIRSSISQIDFGYSVPITMLRIYYTDWINKRKSTWVGSPYVTARGPWMVLTYSRRLVDSLGDGKYIDKPDQQLSPDDSGIMKVKFKLQNNGNGISYDTKYEIVIEPNLEFIEHNTGANKITVKKNSLGQTILTFDYGAPIMAGEPKGGIIYLKYSKICDSYSILTPEERDALPKELPVAKESSVYMKLEKSAEKENAVQHLRTPLTFVYSLKEKNTVNIDLIVSGRRSNPTLTIKPKINFGNYTKKDVEIYIGKVDNTKYNNELRKLDIIENNIEYTDVYARNIFIEEKKDKPILLEKENKKHFVLYTVAAYWKDNLTTYSTIIYDQTKIGLSTAEIVLLIFSIVFFAISAFFIWRVYINCKKLNQRDIDWLSKIGKLERLLKG